MAGRLSRTVAQVTEESQSYKNYTTSFKMLIRIKSVVKR